MAPREKPPTEEEDRNASLNAVFAVQTVFPSAVVHDARAVDPKAERCPGQAYVYGRLVPCGNTVQWPGTMCQPACRPEGFAWVRSAQPHDRSGKVDT